MTDANAPANMGTQSGGGGGTTASTTKGKPGRKPAQPIDNPDTLTGEAKAAFDAKPEWEKAEIRAKYALQKAKKLKEAAKGTGAGGGTNRIPAPSFSLSFGLASIPKSAFNVPTDGGRADAFLAKSVKDMGILSPLLAIAGADGRYTILDGKRRYFLIPEGANIPTVTVSGFPSPEWEEAAAVVINRMRSPNALAIAQVLGRMRQRGWTDAALRSRLGLKTGEVAKYEALANLPADILAGVTSGRVSQNVALLVAKQSDTVKARLVESFRAKTAEKADARLTEEDVEAARKAQTTEAVQRDLPTLQGAVSSVPASMEAPAASNVTEAANVTNAPAPPASNP